jgi:hypothetical protein
MLKQVQELQQYLKDKKIPISGVKKDLVHRVKMHQDSISRQRGGLWEGGMSSNRIVGGESCGEGVGEAGGSKQGGGEGEGEGEGRSDVCRSDDEGGAGGGDEEMQEPGDDDNNNEEDEEGVEEEGLASSSDDDADGIVDIVVRGKRTRTRNPRVFNDDFL